MIPEIDYLRPQTEKEALSILSERKEQAKILAGGTDIIPGFQKDSNQFYKVKLLIDIKSIDDLNGTKLKKLAVPKTSYFRDEVWLFSLITSSL